MNRRQRQKQTARRALEDGRPIGATRPSIGPDGRASNITATIQKVGGIYHVTVEEYYPVGYHGEDIRSIRRTFSNAEEAVQFSIENAELTLSYYSL
jgi:hypothetical protein